MTDVVIALDVGGTVIKSALVTADGTLGQVRRHPTDAHRGSDAVIETILDLTVELADAARADGLRPRAAGVAVPGVVDEEAGVAVWSANLGFRNLALRDLVAGQVGLPTVLAHDVRAGGLAEARVGAGRDSRHVLFLAIGTGIAAAHVVDGVVLTGAHSAAGEIGHVIVRPEGPVCGCGGRGCLEAVASAAAVARRYAAVAGSPATAAEVAARAASGDRTAADVWHEAVEALADGLLTGLALVDPEIVVIGGGMSEAGDQLLDPLRSAVRRRLTFHYEPRLVRAALGDKAGCLGAGLLALGHRESGRPESVEAALR